MSRFRHWGYRFLHTTPHDHSFALWSADATFGHNKYAYFHIVDACGRHRSAALKDSAHRDDVIYGVVDGSEYMVTLEELGVWETLLCSDQMDSQMRQRFCKTTIHHDGHSHTGYGINETCFGTLA